MRYKAGDVVFTEAGTMSFSRRAIQAASHGSRTVHVGIATGTGRQVYESVVAGLRKDKLNTTDSYSVYRHKDPSVAELIGIIAEGFVLNVAAEGGSYGSYSKKSAGVTGFRGTRGGEQQQWGNKGTSTSFYCSNFVARVLLAAKQAGGAGVFKGNVQVHMLPSKLKAAIEADGKWKKTSV